jgi:hypothetical protein
MEIRNGKDPSPHLGSKRGELLNGGKARDQILATRFGHDRADRRRADFGVIELDQGACPRKSGPSEALGALSLQG